MSYKNYILIQKHLFRSEYIFADTEEYLADQLFKNEKIRVNFGKEYGLHLESKEGQGTIATVCLPVGFKKEIEKNESISG